MLFANKSLEEGARTLLNETKLPKYFWAYVVHTICYTLNKVLICSILKKTPYEFYKRKKTEYFSFENSWLQMFCFKQW